jgi:hypothetical protein
MLAKLSGAIGFGGLPSDFAAGGRADADAGEEEEAEDEVEEMNVHHAASIGDVEVCFAYLCLFVDHQICACSS